MKAPISIEKAPNKEKAAADLRAVSAACFTWSEISSTRFWASAEDNPVRAATI